LTSPGAGIGMAGAMAFKLTYSTMFDPPEEMHARFEAALAEVRRGLGATHALHVNGRDVGAKQSYEKRSPVDRRVVLGRFPLGAAVDVDSAVAAAKEAFGGWRQTPPAERVRLVKRAGALLEERVYAIGAVLALEVGKNRMEALGETQETADFFSGYAAELERNQAYDHVLPDDPLPGFRSHNRSVLKPYGVWAVVTPFNFPLALAGGPVAAALVTGNTVVLKGATDTPWAGRLLADCLRDAGLPPGVFNYVTGSGGVVGAALTGHPDLAGLTFTGSYEVGMRLYRETAAGAHPRPCITEMGGKNACIVTAGGDLERAATGIVRSAYGLTGQKCSALSRVYVEEGVADALLGKVLEKTRAVRVGDPCVRENWMGPVINERAAESYVRYCEGLKEHGGRILVGGARLTDGDLAHGHFVAPTVAEAPPGHPLFREEMFQPILMVARVRDVREGVARANDSTLGLTAGCYGGEEDVRYFLDHIEAGVTYVNRPQGATTGAWPGYQPFGGWKGSGSTGKAIGSSYYLPLYLREQSQTVVE
jgi:acyl-CoA reductase-like NAD-dependent aldehyde dehydrogenase